MIEIKHFSKIYYVLYYEQNTKNKSRKGCTRMFPENAMTETIIE